MIYQVFMNTRGTNKFLLSRSLSDRSHGTEGQGSRCGSAAEEEGRQAIAARLTASAEEAERAHRHADQGARRLLGRPHERRGEGDALPVRHLRLLRAAHFCQRCQGSGLRAAGDGRCRHWQLGARRCEWRDLECVSFIYQRIHAAFSSIHFAVRIQCIRSVLMCILVHSD